MEEVGVEVGVGGAESAAGAGEVGGLEPMREVLDGFFSGFVVGGGGGWGKAAQDGGQALEVAVVETAGAHLFRHCGCWW